MKQMKLNLLSIFMLLFISSLPMPCMGQNWVSLNGLNTPQEPSVSVTEYGNDYIIIDVEVFGFYVENATDSTYQKLSFPEHYTMSDTGKPALPIISKLIQIPEVNNLSVSIQNTSTLYLNGYNVFPYQSKSFSYQNSFSQKSESISFCIDTMLYNTNQYFPVNSSYHSEQMTWRNIEVINLVLYPVRFNPLLNNLEIIRTFQVRVDFGNQIDTMATRFSEAFDAIFKSTVLNYRTPAIINPPQSNDYDLLIIAPDEFITSPNSKLNEFIDWKNQKGFKTEYIAIEEFTSTSYPEQFAFDIKGYIYTEYYNYNIEYVLFIGDEILFPQSTLDFGTTVGSKDNPNDLPPDPYAPSDYWYGCFGDNNNMAEKYISSVFIGRFSVTDIAEMNTIIDKTLAYEKNPPMSNWTSKCMLIEHMGEPLTTKDIKEEIRLMTYNTSNLIWNTVYGTDGFGNNDIIYNINQGVGIINYLGHGRPTGWHEDWSDDGVLFSNDLLDLLANGSKTPIVFSMACRTNSLDLAGLDYTYENPNSEECFGEYFTRLINGAVAFYGSTATAYIDQTNYLDKEIFKFLYDYNNIYYDPSINSISQITRAATANMLTHFGFYDVHATATARVFLWLGDPTLEVWTGIPQQALNVSYTPTYIEDAIPHNVDVSVHNLSSGKTAVITLYKENEVFESTTITGTGSVITEPFTLTPITSGEIIVTVTSHNYLPFEGVIDVKTCNYSASTSYIREDLTWSDNKFIGNNVCIQSGNTLTITSDVVLHPQSKLIVEHGAKLIVDGGRLSNSCDELWQGIEVRGKFDQSQLTPDAQGQVILKNNAVIENAREGITTIANSEDVNLWDWSTTGGIIKAENSTFRNCRRAIQFLPYENYHPSNPSWERPNLSYIKNCTFETTTDLQGGEKPFTFISMYEVDWVKIMGNTFQNTNVNAEPAYLGMGIYSIDSKYSVNSYCNSGTYPCISEDRNEFINLHYGIRASASQSTNPITVKNTLFDHCHFGVYLAKVGYASVINNEFIVSDWINTLSKKQQYAYGLYLSQSNNYKVEGNNFYSINPRGWTGIYISNGNMTNHTAADEIYKNTFDNLYSAIVALNDNDGPDLHDGLTFHCNWFSNNTYDITVMPWTDTRTSVGAVQGIEWPLNPDPKTLVRNYYSADCGGYENRFLIDWNPQTPQYVSHTSYAGPNWLPPAGCADPYILMEESDNYIVYDPLHCKDRTELDPTIIEIELEEISLKKAELNDVIDGGQTALLVSIVQSNMPKGQILQSMMEFSPYLSDEVLLALIERPNPLPPGTMQQILLANSPLSMVVFTAVQGMNPALPNGIFNQIANTQTGELSDRDMIPLVEAIYIQKESILISDLVRYYLNDTLSANPMDSVVKILSDVQYKDAKINLVSAYIETKNFNKAQSLVDSLVFVEPELDAFADKQELSILKAGQQGGVYTMLNDTVAIQILNTISSDTTKFGSLYAMNIIEAIGDSVYEELTLIPMPDINNRNMLETPLVTKSKNNAYLNCYPNPATEKINVEYSIYNDAESKFILMYNAKGQEIYREDLLDIEGVSTITVPETEGTYYIYIEADGAILAIDKILVL